MPDADVAPAGGVTDADGSIRTLVLIPGLMCDGSVFRGLLPVLCSGRPVFVADVSRDDSMSSMARRLLDQVTGPLDVVGFSMGGMVAMEMLRCARPRIQRLALLDTNDSCDSAETRGWRHATIEAVRGGALEAVMREELIPRYFAPARARPELASACLEMALAQGPQVFQRQFAALAARRDQHETLRAYDGPALVLRGRDDPLCDHRTFHRMAAALARSRLVEVEGASHLSLMEAPSAVADALIGWLTH
jgi:pimeloyl-ACP methyl ester carboxylesterase